MAAIGLLLLAVMVISTVWFPFAPWAEQRQAGEEIVREQMDAEEALDNYRWFRSQWYDIQAQRAQIQNYYDQRERFYEIHGTDPDEWSRQARERHGRIQDRITGSQNALEQMVAEYNARSADATRAIFKCHLPYRVDQRFAVIGPPGSDSAPDTPSDKYVNGTSAGEPPTAAQCDDLPDQIQETAT